MLLTFRPVLRRLEQQRGYGTAGLQPDYRSCAEQLGRVLAAPQIGLVYGGACVGLMGMVADAVPASGGHVTGVIPAALVAKEVAHTGVADLRVVGSLHEPKAAMADLADAFIALPGGWGTLEEFSRSSPGGSLDRIKNRAGYSIRDGTLMGCSRSSGTQLKKGS